MFPWLANMLGSSKVIDKLVDEVVNSSDEKSRILATNRLNALSQFKVVQRIMVGAVMMVFVPTAILMVVFASLGLHDRLEWLLMVAKEPFIYYPVGACFTAYLGGGTIESFKSK